MNANVARTETSGKNRQGRSAAGDPGKRPIGTGRHCSSHFQVGVCAGSRSCGPGARPTGDGHHRSSHFQVGVSARSRICAPGNAQSELGATSLRLPLPRGRFLTSASYPPRRHGLGGTMKRNRECVQGGSPPQPIGPQRSQGLRKECGATRADPRLGRPRSRSRPKPASGQRSTRGRGRGCRRERRRGRGCGRASRRPGPCPPSSERWRVQLRGFAPGLRVAESAKDSDAAGHAPRTPSLTSYSHLQECPIATIV